MGATASNPSVHDAATFHGVLLEKVTEYFKDNPKPDAFAPALQHLNSKERNHHLDFKSRIKALKLENVDKFNTVEALLKFDPRRYNLAITGVTGSGKSSFVNAIRGVEDTEPNAAKTGSAGETTQVIQRFEFPGNLCIDIWDIPGADTKAHPTDTYVDDKFLRIFDCLFIMFNENCSDNECKLAEEAEKHKIPYAILKSRCDVVVVDKIEAEGSTVGEYPKDSLKQLKHNLKQEIRGHVEDVAKRCLDRQLEHCVTFLVSSKILLKMTRPTTNSKNEDIDYLGLLIDESKMLVFLYMLAQAKNEGKFRLLNGYSQWKRNIKDTLGNIMWSNKAKNATAAELEIIVDAFKEKTMIFSGPKSAPVTMGHDHINNDIRVEMHSNPDVVVNVPLVTKLVPSAPKLPGAEHVELIMNLKGKGIIKSARIEDAMKSVDRKYFSRLRPYMDKSQFIGYGATISAPYMHAYALKYLEDYLVTGAKVLDVGSGSGCLTACMAVMVGPTGKVAGVEHIERLVEKAYENVRNWSSDFLDSGRIKFIVGDGRFGCAAEAPYDVIYVGAAAEEIPSEPGGRMLIPVGEEGGDQTLLQVDKSADGLLTVTDLMNASFPVLKDKEQQLAA